MARNGAGQYDLPAGQPVVTGTVISSTVFNTFTADVAAALTQSLSKDGQTTPTANLPLGGFKLTGLGDGNARTNSASFGQIQDRTGATLGSVGGTGDAITGALTPTLAAYIAGAIYTLLAPGTNTLTTPTITINGLTAKTIVRPNGSAVVAGDIVSGKGLVLYYNGTSMVLLNPTNDVSATGLFGNGTAGAPSIAFASDTDNGAYYITTNTWGLSAAGTLVAQIGPAQFSTVNGSAAAPAHSFLNDLDNGMYYIGTDNYGFSVGGTLRFSFTTLTAVSTNPILGPAGSNSLPVFSFSGDPNTGAYSVGADDWGVATGGTLRFDISTTAVTSTLPYVAPVGAVGSPSFTWTGDTTTGIYHSVANRIHFACGGVYAAQFGATFADFAGTLQVGDGTVSLPAFTFGNDSTDGIYRIGSHSWGLSANGALVLQILSGKANYLTFEVGFREIPQNIQAANYGLVLTDSGKHIYHASGAGAGDTYTIPANGSVAYPIGTCLTFINNDSNAVSIAITTDTMTLAGTTTTGTRTLGQNGIATAIKTTATTWLISGTALT